MDPTEPHADLLSVTRHLLQNCGVKVELIHMKGHQDNKDIGPLTRNATLNIEVDTLARAKLDTYCQGPNPFHIPWSQGACYK